MVYTYRNNSDIIKIRSASTSVFRMHKYALDSVCLSGTSSGIGPAGAGINFNILEQVRCTFTVDTVSRGDDVVTADNRTATEVHRFQYTISPSH